MPDQYGNPTVDEWNQGAADFLRQAANDVATQAYNQARLAGEADDRALAAAKFAWQKKMDEAYQTGQWNGQWSNPQEQWFTSQFGQWYGPGGEPGQGTQTLQAQGQGFNQAYQLAQQYGQYYAPGQTPLAGTQTQGAISQAQQQAINEANITGYYNAPIQTNVDPSLFGKQDQATKDFYLQWNGGDEQAAANKWAEDNSGALKMYAAQNPNANRQQTLAGQEQQFTQGLRTEQEARAAQAQQQSQTQAYLQLLASLRGPADWAKYQQVLGSTPGGMRDLAAAAMGQYVPGGGATTGVQPQAVSLQSLMGDVSGNPYYGQGGGQLGQPNVYYGGQGSYGAQGYGQAPTPYGTQQPVSDVSAWTTGERNLANQQATPQGGWGTPNVGQLNQQMQQWGKTAQQPGAYGQYQAQPAQYQAQPYNYAGGGGLGMGNMNPGAAQQTWGSGIGVGQQQATPQQQAQATGNGTNLPAPNQIAAQSWKNMAPSQQQMLLGQYEAQGWNKDDVTALMNQSLPRYASNASRAGTWRLGQ